MTSTLKADIVEASTTNGNVTLRGNGTGTVAISDNTAITGTATVSSTLGVTGASTLTGGAIISGQQMPTAGGLANRNLIRNGQGTISQRSTSVSGITSTGFKTADGFNFLVESLGTWTMSQSTDVPTGSGFRNSIKIDCTTADASPAVADRLFLRQSLEGYDLQRLKKGTASAESVTLSFWVKATKTGTYIINLYDNDNSRMIAQAYTVSSSDTWEEKALTFAGDTTGAFGNDNGPGLQVVWWLASGTNNTSGTLATSWASAVAANRAVGQVNMADSTSNDFFITGIQLEIGSASTPFEFEDIGQTLRKCQRYYFSLQKTTSAKELVLAGATSGGTNFLTTWPLNMRAAPTITFPTASGAVRQSASNYALSAWGGFLDEQGYVTMQGTLSSTATANTASFAYSFQTACSFSAEL